MVTAGLTRRVLFRPRRAPTWSPPSLAPAPRGLLASSEGLAANAAYMADLEDEIAERSDAYVGAAVTAIATLRAALFGPQVG